MGILDEDVARVRDATDLVALVGEHLALKRVGQQLRGPLPVPREKTPSFSSTPRWVVYNCFGCQASGDAITFVREVEHLDFVDAVERLAARAGITLRYDDKRGRRRTAARRERLVEAVDAAIDVLPPAAARGGRRRAPRAGTCAAAASTATRRAGSSSAGRPTTSTG